MMTTLTLLQSNNKKVLTTNEEKTMLMIKQSKLSLDLLKPFIVISSFKYSLPGFVAVVEMGSKLLLQSKEGMDWAFFCFR